ncbi:MAG TPA: DUF2062 domain-containing protein [Thermoanaerobaculia bacterium]|jgi:hypothetical protein
MSPAETTDTGRRRRRRSLRRRALKVLLRLMRREESLERVAAAVALGVGVGLSPFIGFHFFLAIALAFLFRLNKLDTVLGSLVGNPWTLPPFYALGYKIGRAILGFAPARVPPLRWQRILHHDFWVSFRGPGFGPRLSSFLVGTTLLAALIALGTYLALRGVLALYHRRHPRVAERAARKRELETFAPRVDEEKPRPDQHFH